MNSVGAGRRVLVYGPYIHCLSCSHLLSGPLQNMASTKLYPVPFLSSISSLLQVITAQSYAAHHHHQLLPPSSLPITISPTNHSPQQHPLHFLSPSHHQTHHLSPNHSPQQQPITYHIPITKTITKSSISSLITITIRITFLA